LQSLETSLIKSSQDNQEKDGKILELTQINARQLKWIFILSGIICLALIFLIIKLVAWVKTRGLHSIIKKILQF
jgi:hypothetical protein